MTTLVAGLGAMVLSEDPHDRLVAYGLGSCVGVVMHAGTHWGLGHVVLPGPEPAGDGRGPLWYAVPGVTRLVDAFRQRGGRGAQVSLYGGASAVASLTTDIGRRNLLAVRRALWSHGIVPIHEEVGGHASRTVRVDLDKQQILVTSLHQTAGPCPAGVRHEEDSHRR